MTKAILPSLAASALLVWPSAAEACQGPERFDIADIRRADVVFAGRLVDYRQIGPTTPAPIRSFVILTFDVDTIIKGKVPASVQISWSNGNYALPQKLRREAPLLIGAFRHETDHPEPALRLLQLPCAPAMMVDDTPQNRADVRMALSGQAVPSRDYSSLQQAEAIREKAAAQYAPSPREPERAALGWISAILAGLVLAGWLIARRKG